MKNNYRKLGDYIQPVDVRNSDLKVSHLLGLSIEKCFIESIANTIGTDFRPYKIVKKGQFAYGPVTSRNGDKITIALLKEADVCIISSSYSVFEITDTTKLLPEYLMLWFSRPEFDRYARYKSHGSVREIFDWDEMCRVELPVPDLKEQEKIVKTYNAITKRIQLKQKINENLEKTAQTIYKKMFVEEKNDSDKKISLASIYDFQYGKGNNNPDNGGKYPIYGSNGIIGGYTEYNNEDAPVIGHIGVACGSLIYAFGKHFVTYNGIMCLIKNPDYNYYGYWTLDYLNLRNEVRGSAQPFISYDLLYGLKINQVKSDLILDFCHKAKPIMMRLHQNNQELIRLKDLKRLVISRISGM